MVTDRPEKTAFQAEVSRLLEIVAGALYSQSDVFLRELISNASDACDKLRYLAQSDQALLGEDSDLAVQLSADAKAGTLTLTDNGIGMNQEDLKDNLGTIARSGTAAFLDALAEKKDGRQLIGQFGVGFYSVFMVADEVSVFSRKAGETEGWLWRSDGKEGYSLDASEEAPARGTRIVLKLKKAHKDFLESGRLRQIVKTYSDHIAIPVYLNDGDKQERLNEAAAIWTRAKSEISDEQYKEFYAHVAHAFDEPWARLHFKVEGVTQYAGLIYIPSVRPFDLFDAERKARLKLYVRRVFITDDCEELLPAYLRFVRGVIDSDDLPLNISREMLQHNPALAKIRKGLTKRVLSELKKRSEKDAEGYQTFWDNFGAVLKEGLYEDSDQREALLELLRFASTEAEQTSFADYITRMKPGQAAIYYASGDDLAALKSSPHLEGFAKKGIEVMLMTDPVDEFWLPALGALQDKPLVSVTQGAVDLTEVGTDNNDADKDPPKGLEALTAFLKLTLGEAVKDVRASTRLTDSAVCLVADSGDMDLRLARLMKQHKRIDQIAPRILEINPDHALIRALSAELGKDGAGEKLEDAAHLLLEEARLLQGESPDDPAGLARRMNKMMQGFLTA